MKLRTSSFKTALLKDITRFAPAWALYLVGMLLLMLSYISDSSFPRAAESLGDSLMFMGIINFLYAGLCAQLLFGDLFNTRLCNALHAMPLRREAWFLSHIIAGLSFSLVPNAVCALAMLERLGEYHYIALFWLAGVTLEYLFFFGLAVLSSLCSGNRFAMVAVYGITNFASMLAFWFANTIYGPLLYGIAIPEEPFMHFSPVVRLSYNMVFLEFSIPGSPAFTGFGEDWNYLWIIGGVGVLLLGAALLLYRRRKLESAGDFLAVRWLEPVFSIIYTLTVAAVFEIFGELFGNSSTVFFVVGFFVGFFTGQMLLKRTIKVFTGKTILGMVLLGAVLAGSIGLTAWDPLGILSFVPEKEEIRTVSISESTTSWDSHKWMTLTEDRSVETVRSLHRDRIVNRNSISGRSTSLAIRYQLKNGRVVERYYRVPADTVKKFFSQPEYVLGVDSVEKALERWPNVEIEGQKLRKEDAQALLHAVFADCAHGTMAQDWAFHDQYGSIKVWIYLRGSDRSDSLELRVYNDCTYTMRWLKDNYEIWGPEGVTPEDIFGK